MLVEAPAKLNLFLEVLAKREDGFHEIETLMTAVDLCDQLYVTSLAEGQTKLTTRWASGMEAQAALREAAGSAQVLDELPRETDNIVWRAVQRLRHRAGTNAGIAIDLVKRIPSAAGLGGASSDAAAALVAANRVWRLGWTHEQLAEVAAEVGSDVPFFLAPRKRGAGMAICRGRGERIELLAEMPRLHFVIVKPPVGLSTARVYQTCSVPTRPVAVQPLVARLRSGDLAIGDLLVNRLQFAAEQLSPWISRLRLVFERADCLGHLMSGSGSSYYGVCRTARQAGRLTRRLRAAGVGLVFRACTTPHPHRSQGLPH